MQRLPLPNLKWQGSDVRIRVGTLLFCLSRQRCNRNRALFGFTLAELLICLAILGVIATFTIPKILVAQQNAQYNAVARETAGMISGAYQQYKNSNSDVSTMRASAITQYMNYVRADTGLVVDDIYGSSSFTCSSGTPCYVLHNGGVLHFWGDGFCNGTPTGLVYDFAPTSVYSGTTNGPTKALRFYLYSDGAIRSGGTMKANTVWNAGGGQTCNFNRSSDNEPPWFQW